MYSLAQNCSICAEEEPQAQKANKAGVTCLVCKTRLAATLNVEAEEYYVAVLYYVVLSLGAHFSLFARAGEPSAL